MPKYNLVVKYTDGVKYNILWNKLYMETEHELNSLREIDNFTKQFKDKHDLMKIIEMFELVEKREEKKWLRIEYKNSGVLKEEKIIYQNDEKFLDINYITNYIGSKYNDVKFLQFLVNAYQDNPIQKKNLEMFKIYINKTIYGFYSRGFDDTLDLENNIKAILDFINRQIYKYDKQTQSYLYENNTPVINYKPYRDLAVLLSHYSKKNDTPEQIEEFDKLFLPKAKTLNRK